MAVVEDEVVVGAPGRRSHHVGRSVEIEIELIASEEGAGLERSEDVSS